VDPDYKTWQGQEFSYQHVVQIGSGAHQASYTVGTLNYFPGAKTSEHEAENSFLTITEVKKTWICSSIPSYGFMVL
jgi:hypothetical protein